MSEHAEPTVTILQQLPASYYPDCPYIRDAVLIRVENGLSILQRVYLPEYRNGAYDDECVQKNVVLLHGKPLCYAETSDSPTMAGMLARGCGRAPYDFAAVRERINAPFTGLADAVDRIRPLLGLLQSGWYVIADMLQYPTDGDGGYFANVPAEQSFYPETANEQRCAGKWITGFPVYMYPSQLNARFRPERAAYYAKQIAEPDAPRAVTMHIGGFMSILLDGHHKAHAAAMCGAAVPCISIIPFQYTLCDGRDAPDLHRYYCFGAFQIPEEKIPDFEWKAEAGVSCIPEQKPVENQLISEEMLQLSKYPNVRELVAFLTAYKDPSMFTSDRMREEPERHQLVMLYYAHTDPEKGAALARRIVKLERMPADLQRSAFEVLLAHRSPETEQLFLDYIVTHEKHAPCWDVAASYWEDVKENEDGTDHQEGVSAS